MGHEKNGRDWIIIGLLVALLGLMFFLLMGCQSDLRPLSPF